MTLSEAVEVAKIMVGGLSPAKQIAEVLWKHPEVRWVDFFNATDDHISDQIHDQVLAILELKRRRRNV